MYYDAYIQLLKVVGMADTRVTSARIGLNSHNDSDKKLRQARISKGRIFYVVEVDQAQNGN